jgi:glutamine synthetase adenylyltransferase
MGRLDETLPTHWLGTALTDEDGLFTFRIDLQVGPRPGSATLGSYWRAATAFFAGSKSEWSTTAFDVLKSDA